MSLQLRCVTLLLGHNFGHPYILELTKSLNCLSFTITMIARRQLPKLVGARRYATVKFSENFDGQQPEVTKPKLSEFRNPLLHTFLIASTAFMGLNTLWNWLEYAQVEKELIEKSKMLEAEMQKALDEVKEDITPKSKWLKWSFWR